MKKRKADQHQKTHKTPTSSKKAAEKERETAVKAGKRKEETSSERVDTLMVIAPLRGQEDAVRILFPYFVQSSDQTRWYVPERDVIDIRYSS